MGTKPAAFALDPGLGLDLATFKSRWNAWLTTMKRGKLERSPSGGPDARPEERIAEREYVHGQPLSPR